ncbi:MAG TPA: DMT family transporter [Accumulibacter sp.]|nr:DMT family transporter [Accumulibacter sp.]HMW17859.1 DMT family transporter [Accumulibacter sp.]HNC17950.1 DMT family transporter [Accumulibacter sp.]HND80352.1 DMT family transporter [Accumulibacter sp.]HNE13110.1 DMT family transporter [Accumulibacter sp.]
MRVPSALLPFVFVFLWSTGFIGAKLGLPHAEPLTFLLIRYLLVILLMSALVLATRAPWPADWRHVWHIGFTGLLVHAVYLGGVFVAIKQGLPAGVTSLVVGMQPLLTACGAGFLLGENVAPRQWLGLALGFAGVGLVVANKLAGVPVFSMLLPALLALLGITCGTLYQKRFCPHFDLRTGSVIQFTPTAVLTALVAWRTETMVVDWAAEFVFALGWLVLVLSVGAISLLNMLIRRGSAVNVASLFYLTPPSTAIIAWLVFGETLTGLALLGMILAVSGVYLARTQAR